ncbi:MAG TPA: AbrB/MazE/SpoVT family DNA-binding domain-containing protein [Candidatus Brocadiia bacterium]|nr:AbrB/MazE/SpoVT family DNA-binding domain-containing protein [Candidatus Brocadiia bacterium]
MVKKLTRHGNSMALVLDKPILELLHVDADTPLDISTDGRSLVITPVGDAKRQKRFRKALEQTNKRYGHALKKLAE